MCSIQESACSLHLVASGKFVSDSTKVKQKVYFCVLDRNSREKYGVLMTTCISKYLQIKYVQCNCFVEETLTLIEACSIRYIILRFMYIVC